MQFTLVLFECLEFLKRKEWKQLNLTKRNFQQMFSKEFICKYFTAGMIVRNRTVRNTFENPQYFYGLQSKRERKH